MSQEKVLQTLQNATEPMKSAQIAQESGLDKAEVDQAIQVLKKQKKIVSPKRCFYAAK